jgi:hypothetical protein
MTAKPLLYMEGIALVTRLYSVCNWPWPPFAMGTPLGVTMRNRKASNYNLSRENYTVQTLSHP